jgi:acetyl-CoA carboxylase biotin carboxylase subunit
VTEAITGIDIVKAQIRIADGEKLGLTQKDIHISGHAIECRITAEDPDKGFAPSLGTIDNLVLPGGFGVRVDTHMYPGYTIPPYYDSLLGKLVVWGSDRNEAISRMARCLSEFVVDGIKTNIPYHLRIMANSFYRRGELSTSFIRTRMNNGAE